MAEPTGALWGNPLLARLQEAPLPDPVPWWPVAPGWQVLGLAVLALLAWHAWRRLRRWRADRTRRATVAALGDIRTALDRAGEAQWRETVRPVPRLLKALARELYPSAGVGALAGAEWVAFLDATGAPARDSAPAPVFDAAVAEALAAVSWQAPARWPIDRNGALALADAALLWAGTSPGEPGRA